MAIYRLEVIRRGIITVKSDSIDNAMEDIESCNPMDDVEWSDFLEVANGEEMESCELEPVHTKRDSIIKEVTHNLAGFIYDNDLAIGDDACRWKTGESKVDCVSLGVRTRENCLKCFNKYLDLAESE